MRNFGSEMPLMAPDKNDEFTARPRKRVRYVAFCFVAAVLAASVLIFLLVGRWLVVEDPLQKAQAIAVLSGGLPVRALEAAKLYREGYAPRVWLTHPAEPGDSMAALGIAYAGEDAYNTEILTRHGVPRDAIQVLAPPIRNTADEIVAISDFLPDESGATVIIVTSKAHTRRTRLLWRRSQTRTLKRALVHAASDDPFNPRRWWATTGDALDVVREVLGILNAWAGLPLRPAR